MHAAVVTALLSPFLAAAPAEPEAESEGKKSTHAAPPSASLSDRFTFDTWDEWAALRTEGPHLTVDLTPAVDRFFPDEDHPPPHLPVEGTDEGAAVAAGTAEADDGHLSFVVLPDIRYNPDEGLGIGVAIPIVWTEPNVKPYKYSFVFQFVTSTKLVQDHVLIFDLVRILGLPIRWSGQTGFYSFADEPFCGVGSTASCSVDDAEQFAANQGATGDQADEIVEQRYIMRVVRPYFWSILRLELFDFLGKWEVFGGLRSEGYFPGFFGNFLEGELWDAGPYKDSLFAEYAPDGQPGFVNVPQVGLMVDSRDFEPSPRAGYWIEASARGATPLALSSWAFAGGNVTGRLYVPLHPSKNLTLATRVIADGIVGDAPVQELARFGGSVDYRGFGGRWVGRGMRQQRFIGNIKLAHQTEVRWDAIRFDISGFSLGFEFVSFVDAGLVLAEGVDYTFQHGLIRPLKPLFTGGVGLRWVINRTIVVRADMGFSPEGGLMPQFYFDGRHIY